MEKLIERTIAWGEDRGILNGRGDAKTQMLKLVSEVGEAADELAKGNVDKLKKELGDIQVTLIMVAELSGLDLADCFESAVVKIEARSGKMIGGTFVKSEDL